MWGQLTGSPKKLHVSHAASTTAGPDVAFGGCPAVPSTTQLSRQPQLLGKLTAVLQTDTGRCLLKIFSEFLPYLFKLLHPWILAARPLLSPADGSEERAPLCLPTVQLLSLPCCSGSFMRVRAKAAGVFPSRSWLSLPRGVMCGAMSR